MQRRDFIKLSSSLSAVPLFPSLSFSQEKPLKTPKNLVCNFCSVGCFGSTKDIFCIKGYTTSFLDQNKRIKTPLLRMKNKKFDKNGTLTPVSWDKAFMVMAKHLKKSISQYGPNGVALFSSGNIGVLESYTLQKFFKAGLRSNNIFNSNHYTVYPNMTASTQTFGNDGVYGNFEDILHSNITLNWGTNLAETYPVLFNNILKKLDDPNFEFINITPFKNKTSDFATLNLIIKPNSDIYILKYLLNNFLQNNEQTLDWEMIKRRFIFAKIDQNVFTKIDELKQWEISYKSFKKSLLKYNLEYILPFVKGKSEDNTQFKTKLKKLANYFNTNTTKISSLWSAGINKQKNSIELNTLIYSIHLLSNKHSRPGCAMLSLTGQSNSLMGSMIGLFPHKLPANRFVKYKEHRQKVESIWNLPDGVINPEANNNQNIVFENIKNQITKFIWAVGSNPYKSSPKLLEHIKDLKNNKESFLVTSDYYMSATAQLSDLVLPTAFGEEKEYIKCNNNKELFLHKQSMIPYEKSMSELWQIIEFSKYIKLKDVWNVNKIDEKTLLVNVLPKLNLFKYEETDSLCDVLFINKRAKQHKIIRSKDLINSEVIGDGRDIIAKNGLLFFGYKYYIQKYLYNEMGLFFRGVGYDMPPFEMIQIKKIKFPYLFNKEIQYRFNPIDDIYAQKASTLQDKYIFYGDMGGKKISFGNLKQITSQEKEELKFRAKIFTTTNDHPKYEKTAPYYLHEIKVLEHFNTGNITNNNNILSNSMKQSFCYLSKIDMEKLQLQNQDLIEITNKTTTFYMRSLYDKRFDLEENQIAIANFGDNINLNTIISDIKNSFVSIKKYGAS